MAKIEMTKGVVEEGRTWRGGVPLPSRLAGLQESVVKAPSEWILGGALIENWFWCIWSLKQHI